VSTSPREYCDELLSYSSMVASVAGISSRLLLLLVAWLLLSQAV
jgi:hypothetical protein